MITGLGMTEILVISVLVLMFFGSKELPRFAREGARLLAQARRYSDKIRREMDEIARPINETTTGIRDEVGETKRTLRTTYLAARKALTEKERSDKAAQIWRTITASTRYRQARAVMAYTATPTEVPTKELLRQMATDGKRIILPYCKDGTRDLGIAEVHDLDKDLIPGTHGILEPTHDLRDNFLRSDLGLIIVPGIAFDRHGGRLGWGKAYYDNFLRELKGRTTIWGAAFRCQITEQVLPFDYHDVSVDLVVTEEGFIPDSTNE
jgi:5-formyltetrahydrofolate cyclo-ligase